MREVKRWRYYCDFCQKAGGSAYHLSRHEKGCTANPGRTCGMCLEAGFAQAPMEDLIWALRRDRHTLLVIRELTACPSCILAAIRQSGVQYYAQCEGEESFHVAFDFEAEKAAFWEKVAEARDCCGSEYLFKQFMGGILG